MNFGKHNQNKSLNDIVPVILGGGVNALGLIRSFAKENVKSIIVDSSKSFATYSKYCKRVLVADPIVNADIFIEELYNYGKTLSQKGMLIPTNDEWLFPISRNQKKLEDFFVFPMSNNEIIEYCSDKTKLYSFAEKHGIPHPKTFIIKGISEIENIKEEIIYPCILKPTITVGYIEKMNINKRVFKLENENELDNIIYQIKEAKLHNIPHVLQEYIPGNVESLYTITTYSNKENEIIAYSTGHKLRQSPPNAGTIVSGKVVPEPILYELAKKIIKNIGFYGIANTEFKKDTRDGKFKLIEINPRPGKWNYSVMATGINMPYIALQEAKGIMQEAIKPSSKKIIWIVLIEDFIYSLFLFKKKGFKEYSLSFSQWYKSIKGKKVYPIFSIKDIKPFIYYIISLLKSLKK